jgi:hypothetical protein
MNDTIASLLAENGDDVGRAVEAFHNSSVLLTVPHARSFKRVRHDADFAAPAAARILKEKLGARALVHMGNLDRHQQADLNRAPDVGASASADAQRREWQEFVRWWVVTHPEGLLIDVHSFPTGFDWQNSTTTLTEETIAKGPLVVLLPPKDNAFGAEFAEGLTEDVYQGTEVNAIITMGGKRAVLLEFEEKTGRLEETAGGVGERLRSFVP